jgi:hypothetical protein
MSDTEQRPCGCSGRQQCAACDPWTEPGDRPDRDATPLDLAGLAELIHGRPTATAAALPTPVQLAAILEERDEAGAASGERDELQRRMEQLQEASRELVSRLAEWQAAALTAQAGWDRGAELLATIDDERDQLLPRQPEINAFLSDHAARRGGGR